MKFNVGEFAKCIKLSSENVERLVRGEVYTVRGATIVQDGFILLTVEDKAGNLFNGTTDKFELVERKGVTDLEMERIANELMYKTITNYMLSIYKAKNKDYGNSFVKTYNTYGMLSVATRMSDKYLRLEQLVLNGKAEVKDESIQDTILDIANYAIMTLMEMNKDFSIAEPSPEDSASTRPITKRQIGFVAGLTKALDIDRYELPDYLSVEPNYKELTEAEASVVIDKLLAIENYRNR